MLIDDFITKTKQPLHLGSTERSHHGGMRTKQTMKSALLVSIFLTGCATSPSVGQILTETKTKKDTSVSCPTTMIKVCDGPDKETIAKYENVYCSCSSRRDVERALKQRLWMEVNKL